MENPTNLVLNTKNPRKKKASVQEPSVLQSPEDGTKRPSKKGQKGSKRVPKDEGYESLNGFAMESLDDSSNFGEQYQALTHKCMLLERENFGLGRELETIEDEIKTLEEEKFSLLDELVVLEGLVDPSDLQPQGQSQRAQ